VRTQKIITAFLEAKQDLSPRTLEQYTPALYRLERYCRKLPKKPEPIRKALNNIENEWVRDVCWRVWKCFFRWCSREYNIRDAMERVERPKPPIVEMRFLEPRELARVLAAASSLFDRSIIALALDSGVRASEFGRIRILDVGANTIWITGKGRKRAQVPISPETHQLLQLLIDQDGKSGPQALLFTNHDGKPISRFTVYRIVRKCMDKAGVAGPKRGSHCLRHSLATNFLANGGDLATLKKLMRHANIATTMKYVHITMRTAVEQHNQYSPLRDAIRGAQGVLIEQELDDILTKSTKEVKEIV